MYEFKITSNRITPIPVFIKIHPAVLGLNHADGRTVVFVHMALRTHNEGALVMVSKSDSKIRGVELLVHTVTYAFRILYRNSFLRNVEFFSEDSADLFVH
jgi:hypothetical protein